jgi:tetratricopeptide (TPR) repeat protein
MLGLFAASQTLLLAKSPAVTAGETMLTASQLYETGNYNQAVQAYRQLADQGFSDSALFYNLGNAYYKSGDPGRAILNYRRAQQLAPRDLDINANLAFARARAVDQFDGAEAGSEGFLAELGRWVQGRLSHDELAMAALGAWILFSFLLILLISARAGSAWRSGLRYALAVTAILLAVGVLALGSSVYVDKNHTPAVIVASEVDVTSGPGSQYLTEFTLHSGAEVDLVEVRGSWARLALPGGELEGWVPVTTVETIQG